MAGMGIFIVFVFIFFFKQKTAYEIYQCDWSSDVCSSDLIKSYTVSEPFQKNEKMRCYRFGLPSCEFEGRIVTGGISWHTRSDHRKRNSG